MNPTEIFLVMSMDFLDETTRIILVWLILISVSPLICMTFCTDVFCIRCELGDKLYIHQDKFTNSKIVL